VWHAVGNEESKRAGTSGERRIVGAFERASDTGDAVVSVDGAMGDRPVVDRSRRAIERSDEAKR